MAQAYALWIPQVWQTNNMCILFLRKGNYVTSHILQKPGSCYSAGYIQSLQVPWLKLLLFFN